MFGPLTYDGMMRLARASPRRKTPNRAELGSSPEVIEPENARVDDDMEQEDAFRVFEQSDQVVFTLGRALKMTGSAPNVVYKCCSKRCLHALEIQHPGWITRQRDKLRILSQNRKATDRVRMALGVLNGSESRRRFQRKEGMPHCDAFTRKRSWK